MPTGAVPSLIPPTFANQRGPDLPRGFYGILEQPVPLAGCELPVNYDGFGKLHELGFHWVYCLCSRTPRYSAAPLTFAVAEELDDLSCRTLPLHPSREAALIELIASNIVSDLSKGRGCLVHCAAGRGRTGSVLGVALPMLGVPAQDVIDHLNAVHQFRNGASWPESPWQADLVRRDYPQVRPGAFHRTSNEF
ncbi:MAG: hypothetical protein EOP84_08785 [Verrucomicrobiaceae bacterium]|nr:MAG: hypothetical protein EOP84_08785 [Verrucomicrobiaceae bacterium]